MEIENKLLLSLIGVLIGVFTLSILFRTFSIVTTLFLFFFIVLSIGYFMLMKYVSEIESKKFKDETIEKNSFDYCWQRINIILDRMPGYHGIVWDRGEGVTSIQKNYTLNNQSTPFLALLARNAKTRNIVNLIYDMKGENIVKFESNPSSNELLNPFYNFEPEKMQSSLGGMNPMMMGNTRRGKYGMRNYANPQNNYGLYDQPSSVNVNVGNNSESSAEQRKKESEAMLKKLQK